MDRRRESFDSYTGKYDAYGVLASGYEPGESPGAIVNHPCGFDYLNSPKCRRVGARYMPEEWLNALLDAGWFELRDGKLYDRVDPETADAIRAQEAKEA